MTAIIRTPVGSAATGEGRRSTTARSSVVSTWQDDHWLAELVSAAQAGDRAAFETLVVTIGPPVYRYLALRLDHDGDARDALQETLVAVWQGIDGLRRRESFRSWVLTIAARKAVLALRSREPAGASVFSEPTTESGGPEEPLHMELALQSLPDAWRDVLLLRYVVGLSEREAAAALGVRVGTVKSRTARARERLASLLEEQEPQ